jgi:hypothetical protein
MAKIKKKEDMIADKKIPLKNTMVYNHDLHHPCSGINTLTPP